MIRAAATRNPCVCCSTRLPIARTSYLSRLVQRRCIQTSRNAAQYTFSSSSQRLNTEEDGNQSWSPAFLRRPADPSRSAAWEARGSQDCTLNADDMRQREIQSSHPQARTAALSKSDSTGADVGGLDGRSFGTRPYFATQARREAPAPHLGHHHFTGGRKGSPPSQEQPSRWRQQNRSSLTSSNSPRDRHLNSQTPFSADVQEQAAGWSHLRRKMNNDDIKAMLQEAESTALGSSPSQFSTAPNRWRRRDLKPQRQQDPIEDFVRGKVNGGYVRLRSAPSALTSPHLQDHNSDRVTQATKTTPDRDENDNSNTLPYSPNVVSSVNKDHWLSETRRFDSSRRSSEIEQALDLPQPRMRQANTRPEDTQDEGRIRRFSSRKSLAEGEHNQGQRRGRRSRLQEEDEDAEDQRALRAERKRAKEERKQLRLAQHNTLIPISLPEFISVTHLATALKIRHEEFLEKLEELGFENPQIDHILNSEDASLVAMEYNFQPTFETAEEVRDLFPRPLAEDTSMVATRPPVVTIMGHVDHGKTTVLDYLRKSSVAASEFGGITQHIGAFSVALASEKTITFLDTPGHAAFLSMRQRGAHVTDIVVLVVAADDSVMPQTVEAIKHAQSARVPMIVAINKIDKEEAAPERVKADLARHGVEVEDFGGETQVVCVSGKTGQGMEKLEEAIVTLSEILDQRAEPTGQVEGWVLEASTKKNGRVATVLVRRGTLRPGDVLVAGTSWSRVRCLKNEAGVIMEQAGPGMPVEVDGWRGCPEAGDEVLQAPDDDKATSVVEYRVELAERKKLAEDMEAINESRRLGAAKRAAKQNEGMLTPDTLAEDRVDQLEKDDSLAGPHTIPFIIKADVSGSAEALVDYVASIGNAEVVPNVLRSGVGCISEFDVEHAAAARGHVISFNCSVEPRISQMAADKGVRILDHNIIYRVVEEVKAVLSEHLKPLVIQRVVGEAEIVQTFSINMKGRKQLQIAGCKVRNGLITRSSKVRVLRKKEVIHDGTIDSLKNQKKDVVEMRKGNECGISFENWEDFKEGDQIQCYKEEEEKRYL